ncbi:MAG: RsmE family RNA methyltransferase [Anaerolineae bacterium]|nr:16S rRNA (uracil(1498)-N(3))-methyltransferase [Anaerolineae bacterium]MDW8298123.1 RsmE family RNA methyltransferase [Anaerolineae bacterium]
MHRFYLPPQQLHSEYISLPEQLAHQVRNVLRMRIGEVITLFDGEGTEYDATIADIHRDDVTVQLGDPRPCVGEPRLHLTLFHSLLKKDRFEWALEKGTEIGVSRFVPMHTARVIAEGASEIKRARWQRIVIEAAELAGRGILPPIDEIHTLPQAFARLSAFDLAIFAWEEATGYTLRDAVRDYRAVNGDKVPRVALFIGAEGGFTPEEAEAARAAGCKIVTLGRRVMRAETASIAAAAALLYEWS